MCILNLFSDRLHIVAIEETAKIVEVKISPFLLCCELHCSVFLLSPQQGRPIFCHLLAIKGTAGSIWGPFAQFRKTTVSFVTSVRPHGTTWLPLDWFSWNFIFDYFFLKSVEKIQVSLKSDKNNEYLTLRQINIFSHISHSSASKEKYFRQTLWRKWKQPFYF